MIPYMKKRGDWLKERREELKLLDKKRFSMRAVAERVGISSPGLSHLENSDAMPALDLAFNLARELDRPIEWVLTGSGDHVSRGIPIIGSTATGPNTDWIERNGSGVSFREYVDINIDGRLLYGLTVSNNAIVTRYSDGDVVVVDPNAEPVTGEDVVVVTKNDNDFSIKILASMRDGKIFLDSSDRSGRVIRDLDEIIFIHPVIFVAKSHTVKAVI